MSRDQPTEVDMLEAVSAQICAGLRTNVPGIVLAYDAARKRARVQPARRGVTPDGQTFDLSVVPDAPVMWPRYGGVVQLGRLDPGDTVLLSVCDREIGPFLTKGGVVDPVSQHCHRLTDAVVFPGLSATPDPIAADAAGAFAYWGREDGAAFVRLDTPPSPAPVTTVEGSVVQLGAAGTHAAIRGTAFNAALATYGSTVAAAFTTWLTSTGGPPAFASATPQINATFLNVLGNATATLVAHIVAGTWTSTKVVLE